MNNNFLDIHIGDKVIVFDEYSRDYIEHILRIDSMENDEAYITDTNPNGVAFYGTDLEEEEWSDDYITFVHEGNFVGIIKEDTKTMKIHTLTITKETQELNAEVTTTLYAKPEDAIMAYEKAMDEAQTEAENYEIVCEDDEIATYKPYRWWSIYDEEGSYDRITIELDVKEVM